MDVSVSIATAIDIMMIFLGCFWQRAKIYIEGFQDREQVLLKPATSSRESLVRLTVAGTMSPISSSQSGPSSERRLTAAGGFRFGGDLRS
ncbi:hypothetical protein BR93DRAFT_766690 [Coniochaeta sp. PMI_546]|nr:hypothetical protein BR93DRAFT_766690 [Coniochaeta sp. PMI_546]